MPDLGIPELLIIAFIVILLFGSKKLPDAARSVGRSLRIFKAETKGLRDDADTPAPQRAVEGPTAGGAPAAPPAQAGPPPPADPGRR
ncbi:MAG TPA: Sec-independent protein translocase subunit TatA [Frankiaceae bacterium]|nr:Sec-independent protein translocase subunit TatA [Frankiaceae bacterium]